MKKNSLHSKSVQMFRIKIMKNKHIILLVASILLIFALFGCARNANVGELAGEWAYIHDTETVALSIESNGNTVLDGVAYTADVDDTYITLKASNGSEEKMRYVLDKDGMLLYKNTTYTLEGDSTDGLIGMWSHDKWSFEFTKEGTFQEDGYFPGYYTVDEANKTIKLVYNDHFEDAVLYYEINGNELYLQYPWRMVKVK